MVAAAVCLTAGLAVACGSGGGGTSTNNATVAEASPTAATPPEEALRLYVRRLGQDFVANCDDAQRPGDVGKQCARLRAERNGLLAYELGPTFSDYSHLIILKLVGGSWTIAHQENRDPTAPPIPGIPWPLEVGVSVVVAGTQDCLRIRQQAGVNETQVACLKDGAIATIDAGPVAKDDLEWWHLKDQGWAAGAWLRYPEEAGPTPTAQ